MAAVMQDIYASHCQAPAMEDGTQCADEHRCIQVGVEGDGIRHYPSAYNDQITD